MVPMILDIDFCLYTFTLFAPFLLMTFKIFPDNNNLVIFCSLLAFFAEITYLIIKYGHKRGLQVRRTNIIIHTLLTLWIVIVISIDLVNHRYTMLELTYNVEAIVVIIKTCLIYVLFYNATISEEKLLKMLWCIIYICALSCVINIIRNIGSILTLSLSVGAYDVNFAGPFTNRNGFGVFLLYSIIALVYYVRETQKKWGKYGYLMLLFVVNLVLTFSRGAILSAAIFFALCFLRDNWKRRLPLVVIFAVVIIVLDNSTYFRQMAERFIFRKGSPGRIFRWTTMYKATLENPLILLGNAASGFKRILHGGLMANQVDNAYIEILFTYGVGALLLYFWALYHSIRCAQKLKSFDMKGLSYGIICATISVAVHDMFEGMLYFEVGFLSWIGLFLIFIFPRAKYLNCVYSQKMNDARISAAE